MYSLLLFLVNQHFPVVNRTVVGHVHRRGELYMESIARFTIFHTLVQNQGHPRTVHSPAVFGKLLLIIFYLLQQHHVKYYSLHLGLENRYFFFSAAFVFIRRQGRTSLFSNEREKKILHLIAVMYLKLLKVCIIHYVFQYHLG